VTSLPCGFVNWGADVFGIIGIPGAVYRIQEIAAQPVFISQDDAAAQAKIPGVKYVEVENIVVGIIILRLQVKRSFQKPSASA